MLSQKLQDDLMTAYQKVYEEKRGHAAGSDDTEKQASQLASDVRYKAKGKLPQGASEEERKKIFLQLLSASPAPAVVKAMAKDKLLGEEVEQLDELSKETLDSYITKASKDINKPGKKSYGKGNKIDRHKSVLKAVQKRDRKELRGEEVVIEKRMPFSPKPKGTRRNIGLKTAAQKLTDLDTKLQNLDKNKIKQKAKDIFIGKTAKGTAVRAAGLAAATYLGGRKDQADFSKARNIEVGALKKAGFKPQTAIKPLTSASVKYEETMLEDKKMSKQSDDALAAAHKKFSCMDQSTPSNKFMLKRIEKEMKKRKTVKEGSAYGIYKGDGVMKIGKKEEEKAPRKQKGAMAYDGPNKERSEAADRVLAKTKAKRKKMKEDYVGEAKMNSKPKNIRDMSKGAEQKAPVDYRTLAQSYAPVGNIFNEKKLDAVGAEDKDIDNDGDHDSTDKYLLKRRKAIGKAIAKKRGKVKEGFSAWRIDLDFNEQVKK